MRMSAWNEWMKRPALNIEEAALLPALPPRRMTGGAALHSALAAARGMEEKRVGDPISLTASADTPQEKAAPSSRRVRRAALHQVMRAMPK